MHLTQCGQSHSPGSDRTFLRGSELAQAEVEGFLGLPHPGQVRSLQARPEDLPCAEAEGCPAAASALTERGGWMHLSGNAGQSGARRAEQLRETKSDVGRRLLEPRDLLCGNLRPLAPSQSRGCGCFNRAGGVRTAPPTWRASADRAGLCLLPGRPPAAPLRRRRQRLRRAGPAVLLPGQRPPPAPRRHRDPCALPSPLPPAPPPPCRRGSP